MKTSDSIAEISAALINLQGNMSPVKKGASNPFFKSKYADLASIWDAIRDDLHVNGLCVVQNAETLPEGISVSTRIQHKSGEFFEFGPLMMPVSKNDAQAVGSAISYAKRYSLAASLGIVAEDDDDGNRAVRSVKETPKPKNIPEVNRQEWEVHWVDLFGKELLDDYIKSRSEHFKHTEQQTVNEIALDPDELAKNLETWQKRKSKTADANAE